MCVYIEMHTHIYAYNVNYSVNQCTAGGCFMSKAQVTAPSPAVPRNEVLSSKLCFPSSCIFGFLRFPFFEDHKYIFFHSQIMNSHSPAGLR